jgi:spermidine synthase
MGLSSILLQILCLRALLSTFSGNELIIGITLTAWLILISLGSYLGSRTTPRGAFGLSFLFIALISQPTILLVKLLRPILDFELGEVIPLPTTMLWTTLSMTLLCIVIGFQFPLAVSYLREKASEVYSLEAAGAFVGGIIFTFILSGNVDTSKIAVIIAWINILTSFYLLKKRAIPLFLILPMIFYVVWINISSSLQYTGLELIKRTESRYGEIVVLKLRDQFNVYSSEKYQFSYPDLQTEELKAHLPMSLQPSAKHILIVGGSPAVIREFLRYPVSKIDFVEIDPILIEISKGLLTQDDREYLNDTRVNILYMDARRYIKSVKSSEYDLVVLNTHEPSTANINRFYTMEFFNEVKSVLREDGILYLSLPTSFGYIGRRMQRANGSIYSSLKKVFPYVEVSSEEYGILLASRNLIEINPDILVQRFSKKALDTRYFDSYILRDAFSPMKVSMVRERLKEIREFNSDFRPVSYLYNLMLWAEIHGGRWLNLILSLREYEIIAFIGIIVFLLTLPFIKKERAIFYTLFTTGYFTMAFSIIIILAYQALSGYIYEMIGLLTATFMLGSATGAYSLKNIKMPLKWLKLFDITTIILMLLSIGFMKKELLFYIFIFCAGLLGGGQFASANLFQKISRHNGIAGRLYAIDLFGSFLGSFLTAIFMVPLIGIHKTIIFLIFMKTLSFIILLRSSTK